LQINCRGYEIKNKIARLKGTRAEIVSQILELVEGMTEEQIRQLEVIFNPPPVSEKSERWVTKLLKRF